ncbi:hypothetical protein OUZ56_025395 [Daphnia magna]|uniref:Uncharacterized protein n=1 Tax=Daphnia magna TaxID=35525 RepID=A0ABQ9ZJR1_9CRUS|nr:hypothetical protein OUZ56_025395 [Daphnia magna]
MAKFSSNRKATDLHVFNDSSFWAFFRHALATFQRRCVYNENRGKFNCVSVVAENGWTAEQWKKINKAATIYHGRLHLSIVDDGNQLSSGSFCSSFVIKRAKVRTPKGNHL